MMKISISTLVVLAASSFAAAGSGTSQPLHICNHREYFDNKRNVGCKGASNSGQATTSMEQPLRGQCHDDNSHDNFDCNLVKVLE